MIISQLNEAPKNADFDAPAPIWAQVFRGDAGTTKKIDIDLLNIRELVDDFFFFL